MPGALGQQLAQLAWPASPLPDQMQALGATAHGVCDQASLEGRQVPVMRAGQGQEVAVGDLR